MRLLRIIISTILAVSVFVLTGCAEKIDNERVKTTVLIYIAGFNDLSWNAPDCLEQLKTGFIPSDSPNADNLLIYYDVPGECPTLFKLIRTSDGSVRQIVLVSYPEDQVSSSATTLSKVINDASLLCPAKHNSLVLWSHSTGFLPQGYYSKLWYGNWDAFGTAEDPGQLFTPFSRQRKTFGKDDRRDDEIEIIDLAAALPFKYDCIIFDSCLMGGIEVAYELRDKCDYIIASPTEIMSQGMPYYMMMDELFNNSNPESAVSLIAQAFYDYYNSRHEGATVFALRVAALDRLASATADIIASKDNWSSYINRRNIQRYDRCNVHWMYDMEQMMSVLATERQYDAFSAALNDALIYKAATNSFLDINIFHFGGIGMYLPIEGYDILNYHYKKLAWNKAVGVIR